MNKKEIESVLHSYRLPSGVIWPIPIILQTTTENLGSVKEGTTILLRHRQTGKGYALLAVEEIFDYDLDNLVSAMFGTNHSMHPGVQLLKPRGSTFISGKVRLVRRLPPVYKCLDITPRQARAVFENRGWSKIVGFHTRNVIHRVHEALQRLAVERYNCDGLFIHPVVGPKKKNDYTTSIILKSYEMMIDKYYPRDKAFLAAFRTHSRYSGPREAVFTALCRKNFGCSHFIVGRDHTGVGNYYRPASARHLFGRLGDIGIKPVFFDEMYYCKKCRSYVDECRHGYADRVDICGSDARKIFMEHKQPPAWFMRKDISGLVLNEIKKGKKVFV